jgi:GT2 family glycosyltransferase
MISSVGQGHAADASSGISVITPTRSNIAAVEQLLRSLDVAGSAYDSEWEAILVDDSPPSDARAIKNLALAFGARYLRGPRRVGAKRNVGALSARYDTLLFLDSDCAALRNLLAAHAARYRHGSSDVIAVAGPVDLYDEREGDGGARRCATRLNAPFGWPDTFETVMWAATANFSIRRDVFLAVGGFDAATATVVGGEDVDLGVRVSEQVGAIRTAPDARALHTRRGDNLAGLARKLFRYGVADTHLRRRHPHRTEVHANPLAGLVCFALVCVVLRRRVVAPTAGLACSMWISEAARRRIDQPAGTFTDQLGGVLLDVIYEAGALCGALLRLPPVSPFKRFEYIDPVVFQRRSSQDGESASA